MNPVFRSCSRSALGSSIRCRQIVQKSPISADAEPARRYPVLFEGSVHGLVSLDDVRAVARADWPFVRVIDVANQDLAATTIAADAPVDALLSKFSSEKRGALLVVQDGRLVGIVTRSDLIAAIQRP